MRSLHRLSFGLKRFQTAAIRETLRLKLVSVPVEIAGNQKISRNWRKLGVLRTDFNSAGPVSRLSEVSFFAFCLEMLCFVGLTGFLLEIGRNFDKK